MNEDDKNVLRKCENMISPDMVGESMVGKTVHVSGIPIKVESNEECNKADWWVCVRKDENYPESPLPAAIVGNCSKCNHDIWYNPNSGLTTPAKICIQCMLDVAKEEESHSE